MLPVSICDYYRMQLFHEIQETDTSMLKVLYY